MKEAFKFIDIQDGLVVPAYDGSLKPEFVWIDGVNGYDCVPIEDTEQTAVKLEDPDLTDNI